MNRKHLALVGLAMVAALTGCLPEKRVLWSPDGRWALVRGGDGLYVCDAQGRLSARVAEDVRATAWLPDSKAFLVAREMPAQSWAEVLALCTPEQRAQLEQSATRFRDEVLAHEGTLDNWTPPVLEDDGRTEGEIKLLVGLGVERYGAELRAKLGSEEWEKVVSDLRPAVVVLQAGRVGGLEAVELGDIVLRRIDQLTELRVAPHGRAVAFVAPWRDGSEDLQLCVTGLGPHAVEQQVATQVGLYYDWTPDGQNLVYLSTNAPSAMSNKELRLGSLSRRRVVESDGKPLETLPEAEDLAGVLFQKELRARCAPDGRVIFSGFDVHLPATVNELPDRLGLFALDPGRSPTVIRLTPKKELPVPLVLFELSPDGKLISIMGDNGSVLLLDPATGDTWTLLEEGDSGPRMEPSWRSANEICYTKRGGKDDGRSEVVLATFDWAKREVQQRVISGDWPEAVVKGFLVEPEEPTTQPTTTQPAGEEVKK